MLTQQQGLLHGGVFTSLADVSCGYAALTTMPDDSEVLTVEFKINLIRPANTSKIIATGQFDMLTVFAQKYSLEEGQLLNLFLGAHLPIDIFYA